MELGELTQDPGTGPPITVRKGITRLPIRFSFFAAAAVTTTLFVCSPHATGDLWVWALFLFSQLKRLSIQISCLVPLYSALGYAQWIAYRAKKGAWSKGEF